jgi:uncharacterized membrane protein (DUF4010 family)
MEPFDLAFDENLIQFFQQLLVVLGIGLLMGLEREFSKEGPEETHKTFAGIRTFPLVTILGYVSMLFQARLGYGVFLVALAGTIAMTALSYHRTAKKGNRGGTTEFALVLVFLLGGLVALEFYQITIAIAVVVTTVLALKVRMHNVVRALDRREVFSILQFAIISALVLPILPDQDFGPYQAINLYRTWLVVVIFVSLNFVAYFLSKFIRSDRSILATGILGGFASSTATTWYFSRKEVGESGGQMEAVAILLASSIMFPRLLVWLLLLNRNLLMELWVPILVLAVVGLGVGGWLIRRSQQEVKTQARNRPSGNPINFKDALIFAGVYQGIQLLVAVAGDQFGDQGVYLASGIAGLTDVDAITISMADFETKELGLAVAAIAIMIGALSNTLVKYILCLTFGNTQLRRLTSMGFVPIFVLGVGYIIYRLL